MSKESFLKKQYKLFDAKNKLYGSSFFESVEKYGCVAFAVRISDKLNRIKQLTSGKDFTKELKIVSDEKLNDTIIDLFNYVCMMESFTLDKTVHQAMSDILDDINQLKTYLFEKYLTVKNGQVVEEYLLNPTITEDKYLYNNILDLLREIINK